MRTLSLAIILASGCAATATQTKAVPASPTAARLAENPNDAEATFVQGEHAEADGDLARAEQYYVRAEQLGIDPSRTLPRVLGVLVSSERLGEALARCQAWMATNPADTRVRYLIALIDLALEHPREAAEDLRMVIAEQPNAPKPYLLLGRLYRDRLQDARGAREMFRRYLALAPDSREAAHLRLELAAEKLTTERITTTKLSSAEKRR